MAQGALLVSNLLDGRRLVAAEQACRASGLDVIAWNPDDERPKSLLPALIVGGLTPGLRAIPDEILKLSAEYGESRVLLLSEEPLVRPLVMLHDGRVWLVGPPYLDDVVRAAVMGALAARVTLTTGAVATDRLIVDETILSTRWCATISVQPEPNQTAPAARAGTTDKLCWSMLAEQWSVAELDGTATRMRGQALAGLEGALTEIMGSRAAAICLEQRRWVLHWPNSSWSAWLCSRSRLPQRWNLFQPGRSGDGPTQRTFPARSGDVILACTRLPGKPGGTDAALAAAMHGGHALVAWLRARSADEDREGNARPFAVVVMEMRK
ncbi:MAG: hypothetical protein H0W83_02220 [Planctomycetes bacterium]|nr:hypothetical protein [Planctomycetota bacterium]